MANTFDAASQYYSGQGVLMIGSRDVNGNPTGLRPVGNVTDLKLNIATTVLTHKGSQNGQRAIDARLQTETNPTVSFTMDSFIQANLAKALRGAYTVIPAGTVSAEPFNVYPGLVSALQHVSVSSVVLTTVTGSLTLTPFVAVGTPWDYKVNPAAGSVQINPGTVDAYAMLGNAVTAVTVGTTTVLTVNNSFAVGDSVTFSGFTGANAASLNGVTATITVASSTAITVAINTASQTITTGASSKAVDLNQATAVTAAYSYAAQNQIDSLTQPLSDNFLRFEGLNTAGSNVPVVIEIFRFQNDPLKELALLSDTFAVMTIEGTILTDPTKTTGSPYFHVRQLY